MQELQAGSSHRFLLKALGEASGELRNLLYTGAFGGELREGEGVDAGWCLLAVAVHMRDVEHGVARQIETILRRPGSDLRHVDFDDIPLREDYEDADIEDAGRRLPLRPPRDLVSAVEHRGRGVGARRAASLPRQAPDHRDRP